MTKPFKSRVETYEFDGKVVTMTSLPPDRRGSSSDQPATRSKWKIEIDGELRAYAFFPNGYGKKWRVFSLLHKDYVLDPDKPILPWEYDDGSFSRYWEGLMGELQPVKAVSVYGDVGANNPLSWTPMRREDGTIRERWSTDWDGRKEIACGIVHLGVADLPTKDLVLAQYEAARKRREERKRQDAEREAQWKREREEAAEAARVAAEAAEEKRKLTLEGLISIRDKGGLTNFESAALGEAIVAYGVGVRVLTD